MLRRKIEDHLINIGNIIGTDYSSYRKWLMSQFKKELDICTQELKAHILLHRREDAYHASEERFYGGINRFS